VVAQLPGTAHYFLSGESVEDAVAANQDEVVVVVLQSEVSHVRHSHHHLWVPTKLLQLGMSVSESPRDLNHLLKNSLTESLPGSTLTGPTFMEGL
jgi:hypothetical protein